MRTSLGDGCGAWFLDKVRDRGLTVLNPRKAVSQDPAAQECFDLAQAEPWHLAVSRRQHRLGRCPFGLQLHNPRVA